MIITEKMQQSDLLDFEEIKNFKVLFTGSNDNRGIISDLKTVDFNPEFIELEEPVNEVSINFSYNHLQPAIQYALQNDYELVMAVDQNFQKLCIAVRNQNNNFQLLSPHQLAAVIVYIRLVESKSDNLIIAKSIHISEMIEKMVIKNNYTCLDFLNESGSIADKVKEISLNNEKTDVLAFSENQEVIDSQIGFKVLIEKVIALAGNLKERNQTLLNLIINLYREYGFYKEKALVVDFINPSQKEHVLHVMDEIRKRPTAILDSLVITNLVDYKKGKSKNLQTKKQLPLNYPSVNILQAKFADGTSLTFAPENDKVFYYISMKGSNFNREDFAEDNKKLDEHIIKMVQLINKL